MRRIGIAILETELSQNTQIVHSRLMEHLRPDNPLAQAPYLSAPFSLTDPSGIAALNHEVTRQAAMIAYNHDFALMLSSSSPHCHYCCWCAVPAGSRCPRRPTTNKTADD